MSGKRSRDKGARAERDFAKRIGGRRVPLSGAMKGYKGDVIGLGMTWECKKRKGGFKTLYKWLGENDALAIQADRKEWLVVIPLYKFEELIDK